MDSTIFTEVPPLRAQWSLRGTQACVPITGKHGKQVLTGVLNIKTGRFLQYASKQFKQQQFQALLRLIRAHWRGWQIVLFLDKLSAHRARASQQLAAALGIELRWLPTACPHLNPVDHLWRHLKQDILANEPTPTLKKTLKRAWSYLADLPPRQRLLKAGLLSEDCWLKDL